MLFSVEKAYIHSILQQRSIPLFCLKAYLTFFSGFILFLFPFLREFSCSCLTDRVAEHPNRFSPIFCCNLPRHCLFSMSMGFLRLPYFLMNMNDTLHLRLVLLRPMTMTCFVWALDCRASSFSYLSLNCSYSVFFIYAFSDASESHLLFNTKVTQLIDLYSPGVMPVRRRKYFEKNEGLAKFISSAICAAGLSVWRSSILMRVMRARSIQSLAVTLLVWRIMVLR